MTRNDTLRTVIRPWMLGFVGAVLVSGGVGMAWSASQDDPARPSTATPTQTPADGAGTGVGGGDDLALKDFPTNARGLTYGSDAAVDDLADAPDLVAVVGDHGVRGFAYAKDLYDQVLTPEEALAKQERRERGEVDVVNVYNFEGTKVVDTLTPADAEVSYDEPLPER